MSEGEVRDDLAEGPAVGTGIRESGLHRLRQRREWTGGIWRSVGDVGKCAKPGQIEVESGLVGDERANFTEDLRRQLEGRQERI